MPPVKPRPSPLTAKLKTAGVAVKAPAREPVWRGPTVDGVTQSLLSRFLVCRERFRINVIDGLRADEGFNHRLEYGQMWHVCEEAFAREDSRAFKLQQMKIDLDRYCQGLLKRHPFQREQIAKWYEVCKIQFPIYVDYWARQKDVVDRTPLFQEQVFDVSYKLPSGRIVRLRGKWDAGDLIGRGKTAGVYLQENKTKSEIDVGNLTRQLSFDLQTMFYLVALGAASSSELAGKGWSNQTHGKGIHDLHLPAPVKGVRYNVIRRPLSGGKGTIVRHKATKGSKKNPGKPEETLDHYYGRLREIIEEDRGEFFARFKVEVSAADVVRFRRECLDPLLEYLCEWYDWVTRNPDPFEAATSIPGYAMAGGGVHWRHPFGVYNVLDEGGSSDLDAYLATGSTVGLKKVTTLFGELE